MSRQNIYNIIKLYDSKLFHLGFVEAVAECACEIEYVGDSLVPILLAQSDHHGQHGGVHQELDQVTVPVTAVILYNCQYMRFVLQELQPKLEDTGPGSVESFTLNQHVSQCARDRGGDTGGKLTCSSFVSGPVTA